MWRQLAMRGAAVAQVQGQAKRLRLLYQLAIQQPQMMTPQPEALAPAWVQAPAKLLG